ncbi:MAG TPA: SAM-dependent methyltransferase [Candidatus Acidoferrales bacterium]|nr:SAM-dependent methyltransferase [Candidatus Acidoferrales bacterium]
MSEAAKGPAIRNVSDTALWVAYYRAMETERPDALFRDHYARKLAGERGEQIVRKLRGGMRQSWSMIVRTAVMDELVKKIIAQERTDMVINLAAGLDARPYRLELPPAMRWVEIDLPEMIEYKSEMLKGETPKCKLERISADLADERARQEIFAQLDDSAQRVFVITEGLLAYLAPEQVASLARGLHACQHFRYWMTDLASPKVKQMMDKHWGKQLKAAGAPIKFAPAEAEEFFRPHGWEAAEFRDFFNESIRLNRTMPMMWIVRMQMRIMPKRSAKMMKQWRSGVVLLRRA